MPDSRDVDAPPTAEQSRPASPHYARWIVVLAAVVLVIGPLLGGASLQNERARWRVAAALEHWLDGELSAALAELDAAAEIAPDYPRIYQLRSDLRIEAGDYAGALEDAQRLMELAPRDIQSVQAKADALVYLGRAEEAARTWVKFSEQTQDAYNWASPEMQNSVAYYRALGEVGLKRALSQINAAIDRRQLGATWKDSQPMLMDTRGYIRYLRGDYKSALADMNVAVLTAERLRDEEQTRRKLSAAQSVEDPRVAAKILNGLDEMVAVIRYHRGLVFDALNREEAAQLDYRRVRQLGFEPGPQLF
ncbi:MAG: hypothetical protein KY475_21020 [Planctomycetes bacterium]|nr:hypothetical protein [Planctomycetota bacterium]